jgi:hypothetical protein
MEAVVRYNLRGKQKEILFFIFKKNSLKTAEYAMLVGLECRVSTLLPCKPANKNIKSRKFVKKKKKNCFILSIKKQLV